MRALGSLVAAALLVAACHEGGAARAPASATHPLGAPGAVDLETRHYRFGVDDDRPLLSGWSGQREFDARFRRHFVWATERDATFALTVLRIEDKQGIVALRSVPSRTPQEIEILVNGEPAGEIHPVHRFREYRLEIPAETLRLGENLLTFRHAVLEPSADSRDPRSFAAAYSTLLLGPSCLPLRPKGPPESAELLSTADELRVTGPAALHWAVRGGAHARISATLAIDPESEGPAEALLSIRRGTEWTDAGRVRLSVPWWGSPPATRLEADVAGSEEVRLLVLPQACETMRTSVHVREVALGTLHDGSDG